MGLMFTFFMFLFKGVRNKEGQEYEPDTLTGFQNSIERHLKNNKARRMERNLDTHTL